MINNNKSVSFPLANRVCVCGGDRHYSMWHFLPLFLQHRLVHICSLHSVQLLAPPPRSAALVNEKSNKLAELSCFHQFIKGKLWAHSQKARHVSQGSKRRLTCKPPPTLRVYSVYSVNPVYSFNSGFLAEQLITIHPDCGDT